MKDIYENCKVSSNYFFSIVPQVGSPEIFFVDHNFNQNPPTLNRSDIFSYIYHLVYQIQMENN